METRAAVPANAARVGGAPQLAVQDVRRRPDCPGGGESDEENYAKGQKTPPPPGTQYFAMTPEDNASVPELCVAGLRPEALGDFLEPLGKLGKPGNIMEAPSLDVPSLVVMDELIPVPIVYPGLVGMPQERHPESIPEQIVDSEMLDIPQERISERLPEQNFVSEVLGTSPEQTSERIVELPVGRGFIQERTSERMVQTSLVFAGVPGDCVPQRIMGQSSHLEDIPGSQAVPPDSELDVHVTPEFESPDELYARVDRILAQRTLLPEEALDAHDEDGGHISDEAFDDEELPSRFRGASCPCECADSSGLGTVGTDGGALSHIMCANCTHWLIFVTYVAEGQVVLLDISGACCQTADAGYDQHPLCADVIVVGMIGDSSGWRQTTRRRLIEHLTDAYKNGDLWWVRPVGSIWCSGFS